MKVTAWVLAAATLALAGCTTSTPGTAAAPSIDPCAAARTQPPDGSGEQRLQADLDGDRRSDEVVSFLRDGRRVVQAWLADGRNAAPEAVFAGDLLATGDVDGDGRAELFAATGPATGGLFRLDGCRLVTATLAGQPWSYPVGPAAAVACTGGGGLEVLTVGTAGSPSLGAPTATSGSPGGAAVEGTAPSPAVTPEPGSDLTPAPGPAGTSTAVARFRFSGAAVEPAGAATLPGPLPPGPAVRCS